MATGDNSAQKRVTQEDANLFVALHSQGNSYRAIARETGFSIWSISQALRKAGVDTDRAKTHEATVARARAIQAKKIQAAEDLWEDFESLRHRIWDEYVMVMSSPMGAERIALEEPPLREQADGVKAMHSIVQTISRLTEGIPLEDEEVEAKSALSNIQDGLQRIAERIRDSGTADKPADKDEGK